MIVNWLSKPLSLEELKEQIAMDVESAKSLAMKDSPPKGYEPRGLVETSMPTPHRVTDNPSWLKNSLGWHVSCSLVNGDQELRFVLYDVLGAPKLIESAEALFEVVCERAGYD